MSFMKFVRPVLHILVWALMQIEYSTEEGMVKFRRFQLKSDLAVLKCCGNNRGCSKKCEVLLSICLVKEKSSNDKNCLLKSTLAKEVTEQSFDIKFSGSFGEPLNLVFKGILKNGIGADNVVFKERFHDALTFVMSTWNSVQSSNYATQAFDYRLSCNKDFYGKKCNINCIPSNNDIGGHYTCRYDGKRLCKAGWFGSFCNVPCRCGHNSRGRCVSTETCECYTGWNGEFCTNEICASVTCSNGGSCNKTNGQCQCLPGFTGKNCEITIPKLSPSMHYSTPSSTTRLSAKISTEIVVSTTSIIPTTAAASTTPTVFATPTMVLPTTSSMQQFTKISFTLTPSFTKTSSETPRMVQATSSSFSFSTLLFSHPVHSKYSRIDTTAIDANLLISSTIWTPLSTASSTTNVTVLLSTPEPPDYTIVIILIASVGLSLIITVILFLLLWKRKKQQRRKSQASTIVPISLNDETLESRPSSISSTRSITPLMKYFFERGTAVGAETNDIDTISTLEYPVIRKVNANSNLNTNNSSYEKYTLQALDRICLETIRGHKRSINGTIKPNNSQHSNSRNRTARVSKTFSNGSRKSQTSSGYCSSGYWSGTSSPTLKEDPMTSYMIPYLFQDKGYQSNNKYKTMLTKGVEANNNNNNNNDNNREGSSSGTVYENPQQSGEEQTRESSTVSSEEFHHSRHATLNSVKFEDLPNFVSYQEHDV